MGEAFGQLGQLVSGAVVGVTTSANPEVRLRPFAGDGEAQTEDGAGGALNELVLKLLRPKVTVYTGGGSFSVAPYGEPQPVVGLVLLALVAFGAWRLLAGR